jgi:hypothetical protein
MTARPILFSAPMVRALLEGRKTQTRRIIKGVPSFPHHGRDIMDWGLSGIHQCEDGYEGTDRWLLDVQTEVDDHSRREIKCPYGQPGDRLWVKETWRPFSVSEPWDLDVVYHADGERRTIKDGEFGDNDWLMPKAAARGNVTPLFMPRWASRLTLEITEVRVERLNDISEADALAEGIESTTYWRDEHPPSICFAVLWDAINGPGAWAANPFVWCVSFNVIRKNIDALSVPDGEGAGG